MKLTSDNNKSGTFLYNIICIMLIYIIKIKVCEQLIITETYWLGYFVIYSICFLLFYFISLVISLFILFAGNFCFITYFYDYNRFALGFVKSYQLIITGTFELTIYKNYEMCLWYLLIASIVEIDFFWSFALVAKGDNWDNRFYIFIYFNQDFLLTVTILKCPLHFFTNLRNCIY